MRVVIDLALIVVFTVIGRASHTETLDLAGIATTAWPFVTAGAIGSLASRRMSGGRWWLEGLLCCVITVVLGMLLRGLTGGGTAPAFVLVATLTLAVLLIGWRGIAVLLGRYPQ